MGSKNFFLKKRIYKESIVKFNQWILKANNWFYRKLRLKYFDQFLYFLPLLKSTVVAAVFWRRGYIVDTEGTIWPNVVFFLINQIEDNL